MADDKKILKTTRTATWTVETVWPDHYDGDSLADAAKWEKELEPCLIVESLANSLDAIVTAEVEVLDPPQDSITYEQR